MKSRAAIAWEAGKPLTIEEVDVEGPKKGEVLVRAKENAYRDRKVVGRASLSDICGGQVNGDPFHREEVARIANSGSHSLPCFLNGGIGQAYNGDEGKAIEGAVSVIAP